MARLPSPDSVATKVAAIKVNETIVLTNPYSSVMVMVCLLRKKKEHEKKLFKVKYVDHKTSVTRIK
jgi:hypothetical protein